MAGEVTEVVAAIREDFLEDTAVFRVDTSGDFPDADSQVASLVAEDLAAEDSARVHHSAVSGAIPEEDIEGVLVPPGATAHIEVAAIAQGTVAAMLEGIITGDITIPEAITDGIPGTTTEDGLPMVQHSGFSSAASWSEASIVPSGGRITTSQFLLATMTRTISFLILPLPM